MQRIPWIDPLRALAASLVLLSHVAYWSGASDVDGVGRLAARGDAGVAVFFAISACLLTRSASAGLPPEKGYARKRAARILPGYVVALIAVLAVTAWSHPDQVTPRAVLAHAVLVQGLTGDSFVGFTQAWSLTTEVTFYLAVPLVNRWLRWCAATDRSPLPVLAGVAGAGIVLQMLSAASGVRALGVLSTSAPAHAAWFAVGIACGWIAVHGALPSISSLRLVSWAATIYVVAATPLGGPLHLETPSHLTAATKEALYATLAALLLLGALAAAAPRTDQAREAARTAGNVSYGVFLWHVLVLDVLFTALGLRLFHAPFVLVLVVTLTVTFGLARLSWLAVERPAVRWAHTGDRAPGA